MITPKRLQTARIAFFLPDDPAISIPDAAREQYLRTGDTSLVEVTGSPTRVEVELPRGRDMDEVMISSGRPGEAHQIGMRMLLELFRRCCRRVGPVPDGEGGERDLDEDEWEDALSTEDRILVGAWIREASSAPGAEDPEAPLPSAPRRSRRRGSRGG